MYIRNRERALRRRLCLVAAAMIGAAMMTAGVKLFSLAYAEIPAVFTDDKAGIGLALSLICLVAMIATIKLGSWATKDGLEYGFLAMYAWTGKDIFDAENDETQIALQIQARMVGMGVAVFANSCIVCYRSMSMSSLGDTSGQPLSTRVELRTMGRSWFVLAVLAAVFLAVACAAAVLILTMEVIGFVRYRQALRRVQGKS